MIEWAGYLLALAYEHFWAIAIFVLLWLIKGHLTDILRELRGQIIVIIALAVLVSVGPPAQAAPLPFPTESCQVTAAFPPEAETLIIQNVARAQSEILVAIYSFTNQRIANALIAAAGRGVKISLIADRTESGTPTQAALLNQLQAWGVDVVVSTLWRTMHDKYMIIDRRIVLTGSYNYTNNAQFVNEENLVAISCRSVAAEFAVNWGGMKFSRQQQQVNGYQKTTHKK